MLNNGYFIKDIAYSSIYLMPNSIIDYSLNMLSHTMILYLDIKTNKLLLLKAIVNLI